MDFSGEEDTELDPLKRTDSTASGFFTKSGNFNFERTGSNASGFLTKSGNFNFGADEAALLQQPMGPTQQSMGPTHTVGGGAGIPTTVLPTSAGEPCVQPVSHSLQAGSLQAGSLQAGSLHAGSLQAGSLHAGSLHAGSLQAGSLQAGGSKLQTRHIAVSRSCVSLGTLYNFPPCMLLQMWLTHYLVVSSAVTASFTFTCPIMNV